MNPRRPTPRVVSPTRPRLIAIIHHGFQHIIAGNGARFRGFIQLRSPRNLSSALMENAGYSRPDASRDRVHPCRRANVVGDSEKQPAGGIGWRPIRDDRRGPLRSQIPRGQFNGVGPFGEHFNGTVDPGAHYGTAGEANFLTTVMGVKGLNTFCASITRQKLGQRRKLDMTRSIFWLSFLTL